MTSTFRLLTGASFVPLTQVPRRYTLTPLGRNSRRCQSRSAGSMASSRKEWRFAPLNPELAKDSSKPKLAGIVFDVDGTLCLPQSYIFAQMRSFLSIGPETDILAHLHSLPEPQHTTAAEGIKNIERAAMASQTPQPALQELMKYLDSRGVRKAVCSRNFDEPVMHLLDTFLSHTKFEPVLTRAYEPCKPAPDGILYCARHFGEDPSKRAESCIMVGDSGDDVVAGKRAGAATVLLTREGNESTRTLEETDFVIDRLDELIEMLENGAVKS